MSLRCRNGPACCTKKSTRKLSSETNRHLYILSLMTAFLLPPTLVTGFFGMNTGNLPFADGSGGTEYAMALIIASVLLAWWLLKRVDIL